MLKVGLTGGVASGKSAVAELFAKRGAPVIDSDLLARSVVEPSSQAYNSIVKHFGPQILNPNNSLNRAALRQWIFDHPEARLWLQNLLHPLIRSEIKKQLAILSAPYCIIVIPLLSESKGIDFIDRICVVDCPLESQLQRIQVRDHSTREEAFKIIESQHSREQRLSIADDIIVNESDIRALEEQVAHLDQMYSKARVE